MRFVEGLREFTGIFSASLPFTIAALLLVVNSFCDQFFITLGGIYPTQAYSLCVPVYAIIVASGTVFGGIAGTKLSRYLADGNNESANRFIMQIIVIALIYGLVMATVIWVAFVPLYSFVADENVRREANQFLLPILFAFFGITLNGVLLGILNAIGLKKQYYSALVMMTFSNIICDTILVRILGLGTFGNAFSTAVSLLWTGLCAAYWINRSSSPLRLTLENLNWSTKEYADISYSANRTLIRVIFKNVGEFLIRLLLFMKYALSYGIPMLCSSFIITLGIGAGLSLAPRFANMRVEHDVEGGMHLLKISVFYGFVLLLALSILMSLMADPIAGVFCNHPTLAYSRSSLVKVLAVLCLSAPFAGVYNICNAVFLERLSKSYTTGIYAVMQLVKFGVYYLMFSYSFTALIVFMVIERAFLAGFSFFRAYREIRNNFAPKDVPVA